MKKFFLLLIIFIIFISCKESGDGSETVSSVDKDIFPYLKDDNHISSKKFGVVTVDRLRFRSSNDIHAKTLRYLDSGDVVEILEKDSTRVRINNMEDYWYNIKFKGITGWVFGYYLEIYSSYEHAYDASIRFLDSEEKQIERNIESSINNNLFFLSSGKLYQLIDGKKRISRKVELDDKISVQQFSFHNSKNQIYYIGYTAPRALSNTHLYIYDLETEKNKLLVKNVSNVSYNFNENQAVIVRESSGLRKKGWDIYLFNIDDPENLKEIVYIEKNKEGELVEPDLFTLTLGREYGNFNHLTWDHEKNFLYFKPSEENKTFLISIANGDYIMVDMDKKDEFVIDNHRVLEVVSVMTEQDTVNYMIYLKNKTTGFSKELYKSNLYPIDYRISNKGHFVAVTLVDMDDKTEDFLKSYIFLLSLSNYSLLPITVDGVSYQPRWSKVIQ